jgi:transcriptional regulator
MVNQLGMEKSVSIKQLRAQGLSQREIVKGQSLDTRQKAVQTVPKRPPGRQNCRQAQTVPKCQPG